MRKSEATTNGPHRREVYVGSFHNGPVHKPVSFQEALKMLGAKAAADKERDKLKKTPARDVKKVRSKSEVISQAKKDGKTVHFSNLVNLCHVKNVELAKHLQKYKGRGVLRGDNVKDEEGSRAVCTEGAFASQMAAAKFQDTI